MRVYGRLRSNHEQAQKWTQYPNEVVKAAKERNVVETLGRHRGDRTQSEFDGSSSKSSKKGGKEKK